MTLLPFFFLSLFQLLTSAQPFDKLPLTGRPLKVHSAYDGLFYAVANETAAPPWLLPTADERSVINLTSRFEAVQFWISKNCSVYYYVPHSVPDVLPLSVKQIVMMTPVEFDEFPELRFVGRSEVKFFQLNALSGHVREIRKNSMTDPQEYHSVDELISAPIYLSRVDYSIQVYNMTDASVILNRTIHEFVPLNNSRNFEFHLLLESELQLMNRQCQKSTLSSGARLTKYRVLGEDIAGTERHREYCSGKRLCRTHRKPLFTVDSYLGRERISVSGNSLVTIDASATLFWVAVFSVLTGSLVVAIIAIIYLGLVNLKYMKQEQARSRATSSTNDRTVSLNNSPNGSPFGIHPKEANSCIVNNEAYNGEYPNGDPADPFSLGAEEDPASITQLNPAAYQVPPYPSNPEGDCAKEDKALEKVEVVKQQLILAAEEENKNKECKPSAEKKPVEEARESDPNSSKKPAEGGDEDRIYASFERYLEENKYRAKYEEIKLLGRGGFAEVFVARYIVDGNLYAIKKVPVVLEEGEELKQHRAYREIEAMTKLNHQNIVRYMTCWIEKGGRPFVGDPAVSKSSKSIVYTHTELKTSELPLEWDRGKGGVAADSSEEEDEDDGRSSPKQAVRRHKVPLVFYIQMEYCTGSSLADYIKSRPDPSNNLKYFQQIVSALKEIHANGLIHRDIKPANLLIDKGGNLKIGDFGLAVYQTADVSSDFTQEGVSACSLRSELTAKAGTKQYLSPEQLANQQYDEKVDIYSTGLILMELCCMFETMHEKYNAFQGIRKARILPEGLKGTEEGSLILRMTEDNPRARPSAADIFELPAYRSWSAREQKLCISAKAPE